MKKSLFIFLGIVVFLILALYLLPILYRSDIETKAKKEINKRTTAHVNFERVSVSFFKDFPNPTVSLHNLDITGEQEFTGDTLANIEEVAVEMSLWAYLVNKETELKSIHLKDARIDIVVLKNGNANYDIFIADTTQSSDSTSSPNMALDRIEITNGDITYDDKLRNTYVNLKGFNHIGKGDFMKDIFDFSTETKIEQMSFHYENVKYLVNKEIELDLIMNMNTKENKFSFKKNIIRINHFQLGMEGFFVILPNGYDMDVKFAAMETEFKNVLSLIPGVYMSDFKKITTKGDIAFEGFVKGTYKNDSTDHIPSFLLDMKIKDAMFKIDTLPAAVENIQLELVLYNEYGILDSTIFDLKKLHVDMGKHPIDGHIKIEGVKNYRVDADIIADMNLAELEAMYPIKGIKLNGKLDFELKAKGNYKSADNISKKTQQLPSFHLNLKLANGKIKYDSLPAAIQDIELHLLVDNKDGNIENTIVDFKSIHMNMAGNPLHGYARIEGYANYKLDADIKTTLNLEDIEKMYPVKGLTMKGIFDLDLETHGVYNSIQKKFPAVDAKINLTNGYVKSDNYPEPIENMHLMAEAINKTGQLSDTKLNISKLTYTLEEEPFEISGNVSDFENYLYDLKIKGVIDIEKITKIYPVTDMSFSGIIDTDIETRGKVSDIDAGRYDRTSTDGSIEIKNMKISGDNLPKTIVIKDALFAFTPSKIIMKKFEGNFGKSDISITGDLFNYMSFISHNDDLIKGDIMLNCDTLDINEWVASTKRVSPHTDSTHAKIGVWEVPKNVDFTFDSDIKYLLYEDIHIKNMDGEIKIKDGILSLNETGFNTLNALFNVSGDYNTQNIKHPLFDFDLEIKELDINKVYKEVKLIRELAPAVADAYGVFSISYKLKGELDKTMSPKTETLVGGGEVRIADAKINGMKIFEEISKAAKKKEINDPHLKDLVIVTEIKDNQIFVKPFSMKISGFDAKVEGKNDIQGSINYIIKLQLLAIDIPFHVTGTYDNPKVALGKGHQLPEEPTNK